MVRVLVVALLKLVLFDEASRAFEKFIDGVRDQLVLGSVREPETNPRLVVVTHVEGEEVERHLRRNFTLRLQLALSRARFVDFDDFEGTEAQVLEKEWRIQGQNILQRVEVLRSFRQALVSLYVDCDVEVLVQLDLLALQGLIVL